MKTLINDFRSLPLSHQCLVLVELIAVLALVMLAPPAAAQSGNVYGNQQIQSQGDTLEGVVVKVLIKQAEPSGTDRAAGASLGAAIGALISSKAGGDNRFAVNALSAVLGGFAGERTMNYLARSDAQEIVVQLLPQPGQQPRTITIVQPAPFDRLVAGESVYVTITKGVFRVIPVLRQAQM
jgi:outer membrane lipoprotein SlyB